MVVRGEERGKKARELEQRNGNGVRQYFCVLKCANIPSAVRPVDS